MVEVYNILTNKREGTRKMNYRAYQIEANKTFNHNFTFYFKTKKEAVAFISTHEGYKLQKKGAYDWKDWA